MADEPIEPPEEETPRPYRDASSLEENTTSQSESKPGETTVDATDVPAATAVELEELPSGFFKRILYRIRHINIFMAAFIAILLVGGIVVFVVVSQRQQSPNTVTVSTSEDLSQEALDELLKKDTTIGDVSKTVTVEANAIFNGKVLVKDNLDVAGSINIGGPLSLPGITVAGSSRFEQVAISDNLDVQGALAVQGTLTVQSDLSVSGNGSFDGNLSAQRISAESIQFNGNLEFTRHIDAGGPTPSVVRGGAVGGGGTVSVSGTDSAGTVTINTGGGNNTGILATITFARVFNASPHVVITPVGSATGRLDFYTTRGTASFSIGTANATAGSTTYVFDYIVIE